MFSANLFGQQIAHETIINGLRGHLGNKDSQKALVMSFHGTPGTGKNYVAQMIATVFYEKGIHSQYYHFFNGRNDFPLQEKIDQYKVYSNIQI
jgi:replication-associated recombination protein RarA